MAIVTFILGHSGSGKSYSMHNLDPQKTGLFNIIGKPLPFRTNPRGNIPTVVSDDSANICRLLNKVKAPIIIIDDFQYLMANEFMRRSHEKGFDKYADIARNAWDILNACTLLPPDKRVYILSHTTEGEDGTTRIKTIGKLLDEKITPEGMVTIVLKTVVQDGKNYFATRNSGRDTVKSPAGMFADSLIDNDLAMVDRAICEYYGIPIGDPDMQGTPTEQPTEQPTIQTA